MVKVITVDFPQWLIAGGCGAAIGNADSSEKMKEKLGIDIGYEGTDIPMTLIHKDLVDLLDEGELAAVLAHEEGHHKYAHLYKGEPVNSDGFVDNIAMEIEADSWVKEKLGYVGVLAIESAFNKLLNAIEFDNFFGPVYALSGMSSSINGDVVKQMREVIRVRLAHLRNEI